MDSMFTGLVETIGKVVAASPSGDGMRLRVDLGPAAEGVRPGDSINIGGVCQTVAAIDGAVAAFDAVGETLQRTTLGQWRPGTRVNIERALRPGDRLGGHFVTGHVDATGRVIENGQRGGGAGGMGGTGGWWLRIAAPPELFPEIAPKGSIAVDGVSLTVVEVRPPECSIALIPTTRRETTLGNLAPGDRVNIETDILAKYARRAGAAGAAAAAGGADTDQHLLETLRQAGFLE